MKLKHYLQGFTTLALLLVFLTSSAYTQGFGMDEDGFGDEELHATWTFDFAQKEVKPGSYVLIKGLAEIEEHWHMYSVVKPNEYSDPTLSIEFTDLAGLEISSKLYSPQGKKVVDNTFDDPIITYELDNEAEIGIWLKVPENFENNQVTIKFELNWQVCNDLCKMEYDEFELQLKIADTGEFIDKMTYPEGIAFYGDEYKEEGADTTPVKPDENVETPTKNDDKTPETTDTKDEKDTPKDNADPMEEENDNLVWFLLLAALGGIASILTPCVFPMIPITISYFVKLSEQKNTKPVMLSITYIIGIIFTLTFFGLVLALILGSIDIGNQIAGLPWVNLIIGIILIIFTLSFFGLFELTLPSGMINKLNKIGRNPQTGAVLSTFVLGVVFTMTSFACTGPIMGSIVGAAVTSGEYFRAFTGMLVYSIFFATPFFFLALSPGLIKKLPRSGIWMVKIKVFMGFIIFLFVWYFIVNVEAVWNWGIFTRPVVVGIWAATFLLMGLYALGKFHFKEEGPAENTGVSALGGFFAIFFFGLAIYFGGSSITGRPVWNFINTFFPAEKASVAFGGTNTTTAEQTAINWEYDYEKGIQQAIDEDKPVFLYFTAHTCHNCKLNELNVFSLPEIRERFKNFVPIKLYNDAGEHATKEMKDINRAISQKYADQRLIMFGVYPTYIIVDPKTEKPILGKESRIEGLLKVDEFSAFLDKHIN